MGASPRLRRRPGAAFYGDRARAVAGPAGALAIARTCSPSSTPARRLSAELRSIRASSATSRRRRCRCRSWASCSPRSTNQGVDVWHAGPTGAFVEEEVVRWLCDLVGYGAGAFGLLTSGGVMANFMAMALARDLHLADVRGLDRPAARQGPRGRPRLHQGPDALLDRARARRARVPARHARRARRRRASSGSAARPSRRRSPRPGGRADAVRDRRGRRLDEHGSVDAIGELADVAERGGPVAARRRGVRRGARLSATRRGSRARPGPRRFGDGRPAQVVLPGLRHRRAAGPRRQHLGATFGGRRPEYYRGAEGQVAGRDDRRRPRRRPRRTSSTSTSSASRAPAAGAR